MTTLSLLLFGVSLLTLFRAPARPLWFVAIGVTEWGHIFALAALLIAAVIRRSQGRWSRAGGLALVAAVLYATPYLRARSVARDLPLQLARAFGPIVPRESEQAPARKAPLGFMALFRRVSSPAIRVSRREYAQVQGQSLQLELYQPRERGAPLPGVIVIHGGSWHSGSRHELPDLNRYLASRGYIVASVDYRFAPVAQFPAQRDDVFTAIAFLKSHAREIGLDRDRLALIGRSAGGQIALSAAYAQKDPAIKGVVAFYAPSDLVWGYDVPCNPLIMNSRQVLKTYLGGTPDQIPEVYQAASPVFHVNRTTPPTLMIHGARDELVAAEHDERLSRRLSEMDRPYVYLYLPWATHGCDANFNGPCGQLSTYAVERFLAATLYMTPEERLVRR